MAAEKYLEIDTSGSSVCGPVELCSCVQTLVMLQAKFHVVSRLLSDLKVETLMLL